jgi:hypothetical protein
VTRPFLASTNKAEKISDTAAGQAIRGSDATFEARPINALPWEIAALFLPLDLRYR